jgi:ABC-2 type transport system ATP-binding protein
MDMSPELRGRIGYVPQSSEQFSWLTGKAMLSYVGAFYPTYDAEYARVLLDRWQVSLKTRIGAMSPGQQQRLSIVRALAPRPRLLVLDEPIANIDPATRLAVIDELLAQQRERKLTTVVSSHITGDLRRFCSHFAVLARGGIVLHESTETLLARLRASNPGVEPDFDAALAGWLP